MKRIVDDKLFDVETIKSPLEEKFGIPPFSIFDTMQGYWRKRVNEWKSLGIKSEIGRGDNLTFNIGFDVEMSKKNGYGKRLPESFGEKYGRKQEQATSIFDPVLCELIYNKDLSDYDDNSKVHMAYTSKSDSLCLSEEGAKKYGRKAQQTSIFDPVVCELVYTWFMPKNGNKVLDCFAGGSVRGIVASVLGKDYTGIDLRQEQIDANKVQFEEIKNKFKNMSLKDINWICGDSQYIKKLTNGDKFDLLFSCPPYYDLEVYSDKENDLSNLSSYDDFLSVYRKIIHRACSLLNDDCFACFVVGDIRDKNGCYRNFVGDTINAFKDSGLNYYNEIILVNTAGSLPIRINKQFNSGRKIGKRHQNVLVFFKGNPKNIKEKFGDVVIE